MTSKYNHLMRKHKRFKQKIADSTLNYSSKIATVSINFGNMSELENGSMVAMVNYILADISRTVCLERNLVREKFKFF